MTGPRYAELQVTSQFSFLRGASSAEELFATAAAQGFEALAITDRNSLAGIVRAWEAAKTTNVRLIVGCRLDLACGTSLLVYPTDRAAYARLCRLLTLGKSRAGKGKCHLEWSDLGDYAEGLIAVLVPDMADDTCALRLRRLRDVFGDRAYLALTLRRRPNDQLRLHEVSTMAACLRVADLYLSDMNPRQEADPEGIALLADSIAMIGLIQPIAGLRDEAGTVGIVAGGRRWRAIRLALERDPDLIAHRPELALVPVRLAPDAATARAWAAVENTAREDLHPADEIRAFGRMRDGGADVPTIARTFGLTEAHVYRRLALAALPAPVLDALKAGEITLGAAKAFTVADDEALALTVLEQIRGREISEHRIKQMVQPSAINAGSDRRARFVGIDAYRAAGGRISADLFADATLLHDEALLDRLFAEALDAAAEAMEAEWAWTETLTEAWVPYGMAEKLARLYRIEGELTDDQTERYDELAELAEADALDEDGQSELDALQAILDGDFSDEQRRLSGWFLCVGQDGTIKREGPYVRPEDRARAIEAGVLTGHAARPMEGARADAPRSPWSGALVADLQAMRSAAVQGAMLDKPDLALDLLAYTFAERWGGPLAVRTEESPIKPTTETGFAPDPRLCGTGTDEGGEGQDTASVGNPFDVFRAKGKKHRNAVLALALARSLKYSDRDPIFAKVEAETKAHIRQVWTPTAENVFRRVSADTLDALMLDLTGCDPHGSGFKAWKAQKKGEKADAMERLFTDAAYQAAWRIDAARKARIDAWVPDCF